MELTLDEMDSDISPYLKGDLIKRKFVKVWHELRDIVGISLEIPYPEINR